MSQEELEELIEKEEASNKNDEEVIDKLSSKEESRLKALQNEFISKKVKVKINETTYHYRDKQ